MQKKLILLTLLTLTSTSVSGCKTRPISESPGSAKEVSSKRVVETFVENLEAPWSMVFTPDKRMLIAERPGRIRVVENGVLLEKPLAVLSDVVSDGESGLMGMSLHPDYSQNNWLYICYTRKKDDKLVALVKRFKNNSQALSDEKIIISDIPAAQYHDGCRIKFGPDKKLYITTGDATKRELAQDLSSLAGKTLRLNDDGSIPTDNPFVGQKNARSEIWSYGHRNAQGLAWQPGSHLMFQTEHGPSNFDGPKGGDEVNIVERGKNYGWPTIHHRMEQAGLETPLLEYTPAIAPSGATFYTGSAIKEWQNDFFFASLLGERLIRVHLDGRKVLGTEELFKNSYGRIRDVVEGPDGALYFATSNRDGRGRVRANDDRIMRVR